MSAHLHLDGPAPDSSTVPPTVGIIYPGHAAEDDYPQLEAALHVRTSPGRLTVRLPVTISTIGVDEHTPEALSETGSHARLAEAADRMLDQHAPDSVMWACTSGSFVFGWEGSAEQASRLAEHTELPASSTSLAFARAAAALGVSSAAVAASYPDELADHFRRYLGEAGLSVPRFRTHGIPTAGAAGLLERDHVLSMVRSADTAEAEAVLLPDTALHSLLWIEELEAELGKPVLTANQVTVWEGMRIAGVSAPALPGLGQLFRPSEHAKRATV